SDSALRCRHPPTVFLFHATATPPLSTLSLHDALPISPQWQPPRCVTSAAASGTGASRPGRGKQARAIVTQLADRFVDVRMRQMRALLDEALGHRRRPAARQLLQRADVEIAVVEEGLELGHRAREEAPVLADAVAAHGRAARRDEGAKEFERALLRNAL